MAIEVSHRLVFIKSTIDMFLDLMLETGLHGGLNDTVISQRMHSIQMCTGTAEQFRRLSKVIVDGFRLSQGRRTVATFFYDLAGRMIVNGKQNCC